MLVYLPYTVWRLVYYGDFFPNTFYAKMAFAPVYERGAVYLRTYFEIYGFLPLVVLPVIAAVMTREVAARRFLLAAILGSGGVFLYVWRLGGDFMEWRFLVPVTGVLYVAIGVGAFVVGHRSLELITDLMRKRSAFKGRYAAPVCVATGLVFSVAVLGLLQHKTAEGKEPARDKVIPGQENIPSLKKYAEPDYAWEEVGRACDVILPDDVTIATTAAGAIPFFARRSTVDLHGLTNREIGRRPLGPDDERGRLGHERTLTDPGLMRHLGVDVNIPAGRPLDRVPHSWSLTRTAEVVSAAVALPGDRFFEIMILDPESPLVDHLNSRDDVVFPDQANLVVKDELVAHGELLESHRVVDRLDLQLESSETEHRFYEVFDPDDPVRGDFHDKVLAYLEPMTPLTKENQGDRVKFHPITWAVSGDASGREPTVILGDEGRLVHHEAHWWISGVSAEVDLTMIVRHDRCAFSQYSVFVNGQKVPDPLSTIRSRESWGEASVVIPSHYLLEGENDFALVRNRGRRGVAGLYHFWFLQGDSSR